MHLSQKQLQQYQFFVVAPSIATSDQNIDYYYDFSQSIEEYQKVFTQLNCKWKWQPVTIQNYKEVIYSIASSKNGLLPFVINLCDGDDVNDVPGVSVIHELEKHSLRYTGSDTFFYNITTSKIPMKKAFDQYGVPTAKWDVIDEIEKVDLKKYALPIIVKPAVSGGSMGVSVKNVVFTKEALAARVAEMHTGYRGWNLTVDGLFIEEFIEGNEYTTFIIGHHSTPEACIVYEPIYRKFHQSLHPTEQFLSFDRLWEIYEEETSMPNQEHFYHYVPVPEEDISVLKKLTVDAFVACKGVGYARLDFRKNAKTGKIYCLEINAQCGLSEDEDYTSIGAIIKQSNTSFTSVIQQIIEEAINRNHLQ
jgi:D-alanine-D-alanine ligase